MVYLYLGSFLKVLTECRNSEKKSTQSFLAETLFTCICPKSNDDGQLYISDTNATRIIIGKDNPPADFRYLFEEMDESEYQMIPDRMKRDLLPMLNPNMVESIIPELSRLIDKDETISPETIVDVIGKTKKKDVFDYDGDLEHFLAGVSIYILKNTKNNVHLKDKNHAQKVMEEIHRDLSRLENVGNQKKTTLNPRDCELPGEPIDNIKLFMGDGFSPEGVALIIGRWDEKNGSDIKLIEELTGEKYIDFRENVRVENHLMIDFEEGISVIKNTNRFRGQMIEQIDGVHFNTLLTTIMNILSKTSQNSCVSKECIDGIVDFLAMLGVNSKQRKRLSEDEFHNNVYKFEMQVLSGKSEYAIKNLLQTSCILLETDIQGLLLIFEKIIKNKDSQLMELIRNDDHEVVYPLADTLSASDCEIL